MTTIEYYNVPVSAFIAKVESEFAEHIRQGYSPGLACLFANLITEIYFLRIHYDQLLARRDMKGWRMWYMGRAIAVQQKLEKKKKKLNRYKKELIQPKERHD